MNYATQNLEDDHVNILRLIDVMETITTLSDPNIAHMEEVVDLIKHYADGLHHAKEETLLFPLMATHGFSTSQGPVAVMLYEHSVGRGYVSGMAENIRLLREGDLSALNMIYANMRGYGELLQNHIYKENNMLFRMADQALSDSDQQSLFEKFKILENQEIPNQKKSDFVVRIVRLEQVCKLSAQEI